jgi:O-acetyl-ADP-ribose deacetylase (regulator of RNase III)
MIKYVSGNFFDYDADIRVNTVNCVGVMGAGVALQFKKRFPRMFKEYLHECKAGKVKIGEPHVWQENEMFSSGSLIIINFPTKDHWRNPSKYEYVEKGLIWLKEYLKDKVNKTITLPALGCGHGGLKWDKVKAMIIQHLQDSPAKILVFEPQSSTKSDNDDVDDEYLTKENIIQILPNEESYPSKLKGRSADTIFIKGYSSIIGENLLSIIVDSKAEEREKRAILMCLEILSQGDFTFALGFGSSFEIDIVKYLLERKKKMMIFLPYGISCLNIRKDLEIHWDQKLITLITSSKPKQKWSMGNAVKSLRLRINLSNVSLVTNYNIDNIKKFEKDFVSSKNKVFYINYWNDSIVFYERISAEKIGRDRINNKPNLRAIEDIL